ncbi:NAD(P)/FAD-dependent oxidoreductase [Salinispira pacifica]|uniref:FAD dependent oxidoreductase domain-containing protein n=1 Tax=Salinispira pacifica TaxID=1307761 RepID=V5WIU0_9SPIO|nr:FAD-dependent oxidoreductase [Salinispira pacifica]AHC15757.1 hypothetical protein L21SP2_2404 [Salinispira pacifica]
MGISRIRIAGQGIAGTMLAFHLMKRGYTDPSTLTVYDPGPEYGCSSVSQGAINPLVFKRMTLATGTELIPAAWESYRELEKLLLNRGYSGGYVHEEPAIRIFRTEQERDRWEQASRREGTAGWTSPPRPLPNSFQGVAAPWGCGVIPSSGWIEADRLIRDFRSLLIEDGLLIERFLEAPGILPDSGEIIIHARGIQSRFMERSASPPLPGDQLPYYPVKGEVLTLSLPELESSSMISAGLIIQPDERPGIYHAGASYLRDFNDPEYREEGRDWLLQVLSQILPLSSRELESRIIHARAGVRPSSRDRMAYAGPLPSFPRQYVLNGLGTRGVMLAPGLAGRLTDHIFGNTSLDNRFHPRRIQA